MSGAVISPCNGFRYRLARYWHPSRPVLGWVLYSPGVADALRDDATTQRVCGLAAREGYGGVIVSALLPYRAAAPAFVPQGAAAGWGHARQQRALEELAQLPAIVLAWGAYGAKRPSVVEHTLAVLRRGPARLLRLGELTANGQPQHPLHTPGGVPLVRADQ